MRKTTTLWRVALLCTLAWAAHDLQVHGPDLFPSREAAHPLMALSEQSPRQFSPRSPGYPVVPAPTAIRPVGYTVPAAPSPASGYPSPAALNEPSGAATPEPPRDFSQTDAAPVIQPPSPSQTIDIRQVQTINTYTDASGTVYGFHRPAPGQPFVPFRQRPGGSREMQPIAGYSSSGAPAPTAPLSSMPSPQPRQTTIPNDSDTIIVPSAPHIHTPPRTPLDVITEGWTVVPTTAAPR